MYDGKEIALQLLPEPPQESEDERDQSYLVMVKAWDPSDWSLTDLVEVYVPKIATLDAFNQILHSRFNFMSPENIECTKINSSWNFSRVQLPYESWTTLQGNEQFVASAPYYVQTDGLFFVIKDKSKEGREMTDEERELYKSDDYEKNMFAAPVVRTRKGPDGKPISYTSGPIERGIKIQVKGKAPAATAESEPSAGAQAASTAGAEDT